MTKPPHFDLLDIRLFLAIADSGSLSRAAPLLPLALSAASHRLRLLEDRLGVKLFHRQSFGMALTPAGDIFVTHAKRIERVAQDAQAALDGLAGQRRDTVTVWANMTAISTLLPGLLGSFLTGHAYLNITLAEHPSDRVVQAVERGACDLGVIDSDHQQDGLLLLPMGRYRLAVVAPTHHPLATSAACSFRHLTEHALVGFPEDSGMQRFLEKMARLSSVDLHLRARAPNFAAVARLVADGVGIAVMPETASQVYCDKMGLRLLTLTDDWAERQLKICVRPWETLSPPTRALATALSGVG